MEKITLILSLLVFASCGICKKAQNEHRDSVRIEYRDRIIHDTTTFEIVKEVEKVVTRDTSSHLENTYAKSDAAYIDGFLHHSLESKPQTIKVSFEVEVHDTTYIKESSEVITEYKEKELSWWQRTRLGAFWWLIGIIAFAYRKEIWAFIKFIITKI